MQPRREPEDGTGHEFPVIAPQTGTKIVRRGKGVGSDPQKRAGGSGVKIVSTHERPEATDNRGVNIMNRDSK